MTHLGLYDFGVSIALCPREHLAPANCLTILKLVQIGKNLLGKGNLHSFENLNHNWYMPMTNA